MRRASGNARKTIGRAIAVMVAFVMVFAGMAMVKPTVVRAAETVNIYAWGDTLDVDGSGFAHSYVDSLIPLRMGDQVVYCFDDGIADPKGLNAGGSEYEEFDTSLAPELQDPNTVKIFKKLFYFGASNDGAGIVDWILSEGTKLNNTTYTKEDAEFYLEFMTRELIHNITNEVQGISLDLESKPEYIETYKILDQIIDRETGEFINEAKDRFDEGVITLYDMVAQKLWQNVIATETDDVADRVTLHIYTAESGRYVRPDERTDLQRVLAAEIANAPQEEETTEVFISVEVKKNWLDEAPESLEVQLMKNGEAEGKAVTLKAENDWAYSWAELPKCDGEGKDYEYTVEETVPEGYKQTDCQVETDDETGNVTVTLTNAKDEDEESEDDGSKDDDNKDDGSKDDGSKDDGSKDDGSKDDGSKDDGSKDDGSKDDGSKEEGSEEEQNASEEPSEEEQNASEEPKGEEKNDSNEPTGDKTDGSTKNAAETPTKVDKGSARSATAVKTTGTTAAKSTAATAAKTGDTSDLFGLMGMTGAAAALMILLSAKRKALK